MHEIASQDKEILSLNRYCQGWKILLQKKRLIIICTFGYIWQIIEKKRTKLKRAGPFAKTYDAKYD